MSTWFANARRRLKKENKMTWVPKNRSSENSNNGGAKKKNDEDEEKDDENLDSPSKSKGRLHLSITMSTAKRFQ